jgi:hypothetical protein
MFLKPKAKRGVNFGRKLNKRWTIAMVIAYLIFFQLRLHLRANRVNGSVLEVIGCASTSR